LQYKYQGSQHTKNDNNLMLRIVTDGTLYQELKSSPILKTNRRENNKITFTDKNKYDIVIVDEAHEHNKNMDLILTSMKYASYYNNSVRLVIISATMDEDEPIYRRYYRDINDNKLYPFNDNLQKNDIDRINVDRRLHISPPGESTIFKINDIYKIIDNPDSLVNDIIRKSNQGDLLYFHPGTFDIKKSVENLNKILPSNVIALPYHGKMTDDKKSFIENLDNDSKKKIIIPRYIDFDSNYDENKIKKVPPGTYNRVVVIATNVAEASITIKTLRYVVDTGAQKTLEYDFKTRLGILKQNSISESSRLQRRGRVGRVAPGEVYYLYEKGSKEDIKTQYDISVSDINENIFDLLRDVYNETDLFNGIDPNTTTLSLNQDYPNGLDKMIKSQYFIKGKFIDYLGNKDHYDYNNINKPHKYYNTGFSKDTLLDENGTFYIIHPDELYLKRNINGEIINVDNKFGLEVNNGVLNYQYKINTFFNILIERSFIVKNNNNLQKTEYGINISSLKERLEIRDVRYLIAYLYSRKYNCDIDFLKLIPIYYNIGKSVKDLAYVEYINGKYHSKFNNLKSVYGNNYSDSVALLKIADNILKFFENSIYRTNINDDILSFTSKQSLKPSIFDIKLPESKVRELINDKKNYLQNKFSKNFRNINYNTLNKLIDMDATNKLTSNLNINQEEAEEFLKADLIYDSIKKNIEKNESKINNWAESFNLNQTFVNKFILSYFDFINKLFKYNQKLYEVDYDSNQIDTKLEWFDNNLTTLPFSTMTKHKIITLPVLHGFGHNTTRKINGSHYYFQSWNPSPNLIFNIKKVAPHIDIPITFINNIYSENYIIYLNDSIDNKTNDHNMSILHIVTPEMIQNTIPQLHPPIKFTSTFEKNQLDLINNLVKVISPGESKKKNILINNYYNTIKSLKKDMVNNYTINNSDRIKFSTTLNIDDNYENKYNNYVTSQSGGNLEKYIYNRNPYIDYIVRKLYK
jgi:hypothetical protein